MKYIRKLLESNLYSLFLITTAYRVVEEKLIEWKSEPNHKPLIIIGIRQCRKTYIIKKFGSEQYNDVAYFNFELDPNLLNVFNDGLDPKNIVHRLSLIRKKNITKDTLIIFDEIQMCYPAITSLKYFCESDKKYSVISAGSLLGVRLSSDRNKEGYSFPVGKVEFIRMHPMNFREFIIAKNGRILADELDKIDIDQKIPEYMVPELELMLREYCTVGGMPEAVAEWIANNNIEKVEKIQRDILMSYSDDMYKHAPVNDIPVMRDIWDSVPRQLASENKRFFFNETGKNRHYRNCKHPLSWLTDAELIRKVIRINKPMIPSVLASDESIFKIYYCDIGLLRVKANIPADSVMNDDNDFPQYKGAMFENFVLNELISVLEDTTNYCYWMNDTGHAEVDFIVNIKGCTVPIEVKSGPRFSMMGMRTYMNKYSPEHAIVISKHEMKNGNLSFIPLYMIHRICDFIIH